MAYATSILVTICAGSSHIVDPICSRGIPSFAALYRGEDLSTSGPSTLRECRRDGELGPGPAMCVDRRPSTGDGCTQLGYFSSFREYVTRSTKSVDPS